MIRKNIKISSKSLAFSLIEILMSILIVSLIFVAMAPVFTKKMLPQKNNSVVYTYIGPTNLTYANSCFIADVDFADGNFDETYYVSKDCSEYKFTVPEGVNRINLTLVAGGGGGGGAAGGLLEETTLSTNTIENTYESELNSDLVKNIKLVYLSATGKDGNSAYYMGNSSNVFCEKISSGVSAGYCGGKGGDSSPAIYDFVVPSEYIRGYNFTNRLNTGATPINVQYSVSNSGGNASLNITRENSDANKITYGINKTTDSYELFCSMNGTTYLLDDNLFSNICQIPTNNIIDSYKGAYGTYSQDGNSTKVNVNTIYKGGFGGKNTLSFGYYGAGGMGQSFQVAKCTEGTHYGQSCNIDEANIISLDPDNSDGTVNEIRKGKIGNASAKITIERPGGAGGGGAAGSVVRINNLAVNSGEIYTIVVGKGGLGGKGGVSSSEPLDGTNGTGGTSTSIYDEDGNLIYLVNGGAPGEGGKVWSSSSGLYAGKNGVSGRNYKMLVTKNVNLFNSLSLDENLLSSITSIPSNPIFKDKNGANVSDINARRLVYTTLQNQPYLELNTKNGTNSNYTGNIANKTGGFSGFDIDSVNVSNNQYNGLYYRNILNGTGAYIGGLGGFSGLGNKAGCGAFYMGNFDGRQDKEGTLPNNEATRQSILNTFVLNNRIYKVADYYENCSMASPNGQTTEFIPPKPNSSDFGSAGSGGGGGGYHIQLGSGNGGDGQNGYVMIEWRK